MNKINKLNRWQPCHSLCQLAGAASLFLSVKDCRVIINGPRWCAVIAERELAAAVKEFEQRLFCSEVQEFDLVYGANQAMLAALDEVQSQGPSSMIAVLTNCSMSLIGDDVAGICNRSKLQCSLVTLDAGGLSGEFWTGYQRALEVLLEQIDLQTAKNYVPNKVNILGISVCYPNWQADLSELKRILVLAGFEVGVCVGEANMTFDNLRSIPQAALNIVLHPELGLNIAEKLADSIGQPYLIAPIPYGFTQTIDWLLSIGNKLGIKVNLQEVQNETAVMRDNIAEAIFALKSFNKNLYFGQALISAPYSISYSLNRALKTDFIDLGQIYIRVQSPQRAEWPSIDKIKVWDETEKLPAVNENEYILLLGNERERVEVGNYVQTVYKNFSIPNSGVKLSTRAYAGIRGWNFFMAEILEDIRTLAYIKNRDV